MKKFYYFSKSKLKFVEIQNFYKKFVFLVVFFSVLISFFLFGTYFVFNEFLNPDSEIRALKRTNKELKEKLYQMVERYKSLDERLSKLSEMSHDLRLAANLEPIVYDKEIYGTGGSSFTPLTSNSPSELSAFLDKLDSYINKVSLKIKLEKDNYEEISNKFKENEKLFESIPAIKPCSGTIADDFGMRVHPILKIRRMHNGIDIITDVGTNVYAPGAGVVDFIGNRSGFGLTLEIDHGFGYRTIYAHLSSVKVKLGQKISRGDIIAKTGNSGFLTTGPHLHYEVRHDGIALNPLNFILEDVNLFDIVKK
ncbi:MAG: M23 family metallopeptidase [Melioribacter sp.]|uniref:M23 family metallopeptidase n=1 Tax=Rosettibacter primus TaxID=3111523 RepID=UPI00247E7163|nr:M23 family metallopeptidase [Melioribacter sp.]